MRILNRKKLIIAIVGLIFLTGCSSKSDDYQTYSYADHRYSISFEYPKEFTAPQNNYYATENILQNEFKNDLGATFFFMPVDLGKSGYIDNCKYGSNLDESCDDATEFMNETGLVKRENITGLNNEYGISYENDVIGRSYSLSIKLPENASKDLREKALHTVESFKIKDSFANTSQWQSVNFDTALKLKFPIGADIVQEDQNLLISDDHRYNFTVKILDLASSEYVLWKENYFYQIDDKPTHDIKLDFIEMRPTNGVDSLVKLQTLVYVDGAIYQITTGEIKGALNDVTAGSTVQISPEVAIIKDVYIKPQSDAYKYLEYLEKVSELIVINK